MKNYLLNYPQSEINKKDSKMAEMILEKALLDFRIKTIQQKIDQSLLEKNKNEFLRLTEELKSLS